MTTRLRNMFRRRNRPAKAKQSSGVMEAKGYRYHSDDDEFVCKTPIDCDDVDVVWESMSSLTLQDHGLQSSSAGRRSSSSFMMHDAPSSQSQEYSNSLLNDTIVKGATDATLLRIAEHFSGLLGQSDRNARFPVHTACAFGCSADFIYKCVSMYPLTAAAQDNDGRTPFHFLCKSYAKRCYTLTTWDRAVIEKRMTRILWILYRKAPGAIILEDNHGVDPVEYALEADMSITFIGLLQDMVTRVRKDNAKKKASLKLMQARSQLEQMQMDSQEDTAA